MKGTSRLGRMASFGLMTMVALTLVACEAHPNTTFSPHSDYGRSIDFLWNRLLLLGTIVFILVEFGLIFIVFRYRKRPTDERPPQTHGNVIIEVFWTLIPAFILLFIAVPTVRTIFKTQAKAVAGALEIEVTGHQWWWEFKYPQYGIVTANEIYIPTGRTVNFKLTSKDVIHSFWVPQLGGKRDAITNRTNYVWFTPDSAMKPAVWNGFCTEYCGTSHAKMRFRVFTVTPADFASWVAKEQGPAAIRTTPQTAPAAAPAAAPASATLVGYTFPQNQPEFDYAKPHTPVPAGMTFTRGLTGNAYRGAQVFSSSACIGCHSIAGNPAAVGVVGPNLTHFGSRSTIGAGSYPNTPAYLALWIKNARVMKPGILMPTLGMNEFDPVLKSRVLKAGGGLDDQQIADIVAYLTSLK
jgi:cytochrome c oxidase subunit II